MARGLANWAQYQGVGYPEIADTISRIGHKVPYILMWDPVTKAPAVVFPAATTGSERSVTAWSSVLGWNEYAAGTLTDRFTKPTPPQRKAAAESALFLLEQMGNVHAGIEVPADHPTFQRQRAEV